MHLYRSGSNYNTQSILEAPSFSKYSNDVRHQPYQSSVTSYIPSMSNSFSQSYVQQPPPPPQYYDTIPKYRSVQALPQVIQPPPTNYQPQPYIASSSIPILQKSYLETQLPQNTPSRVLYSSPPSQRVYTSSYIAQPEHVFNRQSSENVFPNRMSFGNTYQEQQQQQQYYSSSSKKPLQVIFNNENNANENSSRQYQQEKHNVKESEQQDQNFHYESYMTIPGLGTFKKFALRNRRTARLDKSLSSNSKNKERDYEREPANPNNQNGEQEVPTVVRFDQFMRALIEIARIEGDIELVKYSLLQQPDFHIPSIFMLFDKKQAGAISLFDFMNVVHKQNESLNQIEASSIFSRVVHKSSNQLYYEDFELMCLPILSQDVATYVTSKRVLEKNISPKTMDLFTTLLKLISESEQFISQLRQRILKFQTQIEDFYREINCDRNGKMTMSELESGLLRYVSDQQTLSSMQVATLFYRICANRSTYLLFDVFEEFCYGGRHNRSQNATTTKNSIYSSQITPTPNQNWWGGNLSTVKNESVSDWTTNPQRKRREDIKKIYEKLIESSKLENEIEATQKYLLTKRDLKLHGLFELFKPSNSFIDVYTFTETLKNVFKIPLVDVSDALLVFRRIKPPITGRAPTHELDLLDFAEFSDLILPKNSEIPKQIYDKSGDLNLYSETQSYLAKLFKLHLNNEVIFNQIRLHISTTQVEFMDLFEILSTGKDLLDLNQFHQSLVQAGSTYSEKYHSLTFSRFDPKNEGITNFSHFVNALAL